MAQQQKAPPKSRWDPHTYLESCNERILAYLRSADDHPVYEAPTHFETHPSWPEDDLVRIRALQIPKLMTKVHERMPAPDMLLYRLGSLEFLDTEFTGRLRDLLDRSDHTVIVNASGTGKTRLLFEALSRRWGFYVTCAQDTYANPYGSHDLSYLISSLPSGMVPHCLRSDSRAAENSRKVDGNRLIIHRRLKHLVLARMMIFARFCQLFRDAGILPDVARRKWTLLQLRPHVAVRVDIFSNLVDMLGHIDEDVAAAEIMRLQAECFVQPQFIAVDEAQIASIGFKSYFATATMETSAPLLRELAMCFASSLPDSRVLLAGISVDMSVVEEAVRYSTTNIHQVTCLHSLGRFATIERTAAYLRHFLGDLSDVQCLEVFSRMRGRNRFMAVFVQHVLQAGLAQMTRVLDTLVYSLTGFTPKRVALYQSPWINYNTLITDNSLDDLENGLATQLRKALMRFAFGRTSTILRINNVYAVELGLALYITDDEVEVFEPLVFYRLVSWLQVTKVYSVDALLRRRLVDPTITTHNMGIAEGLRLYIASTFPAGGGVLDDYFHFEGPSPPFWKHHNARLVVYTRLHQNPFCAASSSNVLSATTPQDVLSWLSNNVEHPFLVTNWARGPDLLFFLDVHDVGPILSPTDRKALLAVLDDLPPVPLDVPQRQGEKILSARAYKFSILHVLSSAPAWKADKPYDPPVACLDLDALLLKDRPSELDYADVIDSVSEHDC
ncbi:hypothetical protein EXIGLDRAFT_754549 [Exidia glandulosa HHB12029]|uniref:Uncharacterized protein n=1 Tax=Exidia glandulosa HHB12029 TaxID=1314781 RepID=A0A165CUM8_EXIGL|nr:hypothetical protein EXIGLDRAFT_754549 [Exidia glandulosa HHB12029]